MEPVVVRGASHAWTANRTSLFVLMSCHAVQEGPHGTSVRWLQLCGDRIWQLARWTDCLPAIAYKPHVARTVSTRRAT